MLHKCADIRGKEGMDCRSARRMMPASPSRVLGLRCSAAVATAGARGFAALSPLPASNVRWFTTANTSCGNLGLLTCRATRHSFVRRSDAIEQLSMDRNLCGLTSKYSPEFVRSRVLRTPGDAFQVLVSPPCMGL